MDDDEALPITADKVPWYPIEQDFMEIPDDFCLFGGLALDLRKFMEEQV